MLFLVVPIVSGSYRHIDLRVARTDTLIGVIATQVVMIAVIIATASAISHASTALQMTSVANMVDSLQPLLGTMGAKLLVGLGIGGAGLVAAIRFGEAKGFYSAFIVANLVAGGVVLSAVSLTGLTLDIELLNALVLPLVLGFLLSIERVALPVGYRMRGAHRIVAWALVLIVLAFGLFMGYDTFRHALA